VLQTNFELGLFNAYLLMLIYFVVSMVPFLFTKNKRSKEISPTNIKDDFGKVLYWLNFTIFFIAILVSIFLPIVFDSILFYIGITAYIVGIIIVVSVCISWIKTTKGNPVTKGMYKYSRNPMYLSFFFCYIGIGIVTASWVFLMLTFVYILITILFVDYEEEFCLDKYGDDYKDYMKNTPRWLGFSKK
jgi:protein-S-isoprenylcysteine O-methyltransferase Ste14